MPAIGRSIGIAWASILLLSAESRAVPPAIPMTAPCQSLPTMLCLSLPLHRKAQMGIDSLFKAGDWCEHSRTERMIVSSVNPTDCRSGWDGVEEQLKILLKRMVKDEAER